LRCINSRVEHSSFASNLRDALLYASFISFTGTPIKKTDANTRAVFGDYISIYDIQRAVADKATVPIYYESRIAKLGLNASELPKLDAEFEEITEGEELTKKEKRTEAMDGKAMVVCMSRRICVDLYEAPIKLRPDWASDPNDEDAVAAACVRRTNSGETSDGHRPPLQSKGRVVKFIMTGSAEDGPEWQPHQPTTGSLRAIRNSGLKVLPSAGIVPPSEGENRLHAV
jgi:type I restriction enzyme, R subunit